MGSDHRRSWVLSYKIDLEGGGEALKDLSRRGTVTIRAAYVGKIILATVRLMDWRGGEGTRGEQT